VDFPNLGGGTGFFINTIISKYKKNMDFLIVRNVNNRLVFNVNEEYELTRNYQETDGISFLKSINDKIIKIFVNHTLYHTNNFILNLLTLNKEITTITHDYKIFFEKYNPYYEEIPVLNRNPIDTSLYDKIIIQDESMLYTIEKYLNNSRIIITGLPDFKKSENKIDSCNEKITLCIIGCISKIKGLDMVKDLIEYYKNRHDVDIIIFGKTDLHSLLDKCHIYNSISDFNELLIKYKPNAILETSVLPETYSYTLSLAKITQLPIYYSDKKFISVIKNRLSDYEKAYSFDSIDDLDCQLKRNEKQNYLYTIESNIYYNAFWDKYFSDDNKDTQFIEIDDLMTIPKSIMPHTIQPTTFIYKNKIQHETKISNMLLNNNNNNNAFKYGIKPYCIYFPQFHTFIENDTNYYKGFTDINNLRLLKFKYRDDDDVNIESPSLQYFGINDMTQYNLTNSNIIQKQIDLLTRYNLPGFAMYYYWFSTNTISNKNMIMDNAIDIFFSDKINMNDKKIFFVWANEDWTGNQAFGISKGNITNEYTRGNFEKHIKNLIKYFKNNCYLKINNKPVMMIHHPFTTNIKSITLFEKMLKNECKKNGFDGVHLICNDMADNNLYHKYTCYTHEPNYKQFNSCISLDTINGYETRILNYGEYTKKIKINYENIQTLFFNFDNRARLFLPDKINRATICSNVTTEHHDNYIKKIIETYKYKQSRCIDDDVNKILLIDSWNEWGEKMAIEPSNEKGFYYLDMLCKHLTPTKSK